MTIRRANRHRAKVFVEYRSTRRNKRKCVKPQSAKRKRGVENAGRTAHNETGEETGEMVTPGKRPTAGPKMRPTARIIWAADAQGGVKSGRTERFC